MLHKTLIQTVPGSLLNMQTVSTQQQQQQEGRRRDHLRCYDEFFCRLRRRWRESGLDCGVGALSRRNQGSGVYLRSSSFGWAPALPRPLVSPPLPCCTQPAGHCFTYPPPPRFCIACKGLAKVAASPLWMLALWRRDGSMQMRLDIWLKRQRTYFLTSPVEFLAVACYAI